MWIDSVNEYLMVSKYSFSFLLLDIRSADTIGDIFVRH